MERPAAIGRGNISDVELFGQDRVAWRRRHDPSFGRVVDGAIRRLDTRLQAGLR